MTIALKVCVVAAALTTGFHLANCAPMTRTGVAESSADAPSASGGNDTLARPPDQTFVFTCGDRDETFAFTVRTGPEKVSLWLPGRFGRPYLVLKQTRAASGSRYAGDDIVVWTKGDNALLDVNGEQWSNCALDRRRSIWEHAKLEGVDFRAVGNEPGWHLEIRRAASLAFVYDYGQQRVTTPAPEPEIDIGARRTVYRASTTANELAVTLEGKPCADTMSDETYETTVTVVLDGQTYRECGRSLH